MVKDHNEIDSAINAGMQLGQPLRLEDGQPFVIAPEGSQLLSVEKFLDNPSRVKQSVQVDDLPSFLTYWKRFSTPNSMVMADREDMKVIALLDYHHEAEEGEKPLAAWNTHKVVLQMERTDAWKAWVKKNSINQFANSFLRFIEDRLLDIIEPDHATILELARNMKVKKNVTYQNAQNLANGSISLQYEEEVRGELCQGQSEVPEVMKIAVPIFEGCSPSVVEAKIRYRLNSGELSFYYELQRSSEIEREVFDLALEGIRKECGEERVISGYLASGI